MMARRAELLAGFPVSCVLSALSAFLLAWFFVVFPLLSVQAGRFFKRYVACVERPREVGFLV